MEFVQHLVRGKFLLNLPFNFLRDGIRNFHLSGQTLMVKIIYLFHNNLLPTIVASYSAVPDVFGL
jgi:hypothetical protein